MVEETGAPSGTAETGDAGPGEGQAPPGARVRPAHDARQLDRCVRDLSLAVQSTRLYPAGSKVLSMAVERARASLLELTSDGDLILEVLPAGFRVGDHDVAASAVVVEQTARQLHYHGVARLRLTGDLDHESLGRLIELVATDRKDLSSRGGFDWVVEQERLRGVDVEPLKLERLFRDAGEGEGGKREDPIWSFLVGEFVETSSGDGGVDMEELFESPDQAKAFVTWIHTNAGKLSAMSGYTQPELLRGLWEKLGDLEVKVWAEQLNFLVLAVKDAFDQIDPDTLVDLMAEPVEAGGTDVTGRLAGALDDAQIEELILHTLHTRVSSPRLYGLFWRLLESREDRDKIVRKVRSGVDEAVQDGERGDSIVHHWAKLNEVLSGEAPERWVRAGYQTTLESLMSQEEPGNAWPLERIRPRLVEMEPYHVLRQKCLVLTSCLRQVHEEEQFENVSSDLEEALPEFFVNDDYETAEIVLTAVAQQAANDSGRSDEQRALVGGVLDRFFGSEFLADLIRESLARPDRDVATVTRILKLHGAGVVPVLLDMLSEEDSRRVREGLIRLLVSLGDEVLGEIEKRFGDDRWYFLRNLAVILGDIGDPELSPQLRTAVEHPEPRVRLEGVRALIKVGGETAAGLLARTVHDVDAAVQVHAIHGLGHVGSADDAARLFPFLELPNWRGQNTDILITAAIAVGRLGNGAALPYLEPLTRRPWIFRRRRRPVRAAARWARSALAGERPGRPPEIRQLAPLRPRHD